jgi:hypothetical protein
MRRAETVPDGESDFTRRRVIPSPRLPKKPEKSDFRPEHDPLVERQQRFDMVCETISRDDTSGERAKATRFLRAAMEPHVRRSEPHFLRHTPRMLPKI